jgi:hypothetical protein
VNYALGPLPKSEHGLSFYDEGGMHEVLGAGYTADEVRAYATTELIQYRAKLITEFERRHELHKHNHNYYACLAREFKEGLL